MCDIRLKRGRERSVLRKHPWLFSGGIAKVSGQPEPGGTVEVLDQKGNWLARAAYSPYSQIRARIWTWEKGESVDPGFFKRRFDHAIQARSPLSNDLTTTAYREVFAESDGIPGLIVDRYGSLRVVQLSSAGVEHWRDCIISNLIERGDCEGIFERSDLEVREKEGLSPRTGHLWGREPDDDVVISENGLEYRIDILEGQKTGFYLDQRDSRRLARSMIMDGEVLNCFAYTGGFTLAALAGGASRVLSIDTSAAALELAKENVERNHLPLEACEWVDGDVFAEMRRMRDSRRHFDTVILDPPRFASTASQAQRAARGYKDINLLAFKLLRPGGLLFTFSCSGGVNPALFQKIVADAALDAGVGARVIHWLGQPIDHPVALNFPEGRYLKGLVCRVFS